MVGGEDQQVEDAWLKKIWAGMEVGMHPSK
jgi:hypothetical protein